MRNQSRRRGQFKKKIDNMAVIDYKNVDLLKHYLTETGRIVSSRVTGLSARKQRALAHQIKLARFLALLPYCEHKL